MIQLPEPEEGRSRVDSRVLGPGSKVIFERWTATETAVAVRPLRTAASNSPGRLPGAAPARVGYHYEVVTCRVPIGALTKSVTLSECYVDCVFSSVR